MDEKKKKLIVMVFTALLSLAVSAAACLLGIPEEEFMPNVRAAYTVSESECACRTPSPYYSYYL